MEINKRFELFKEKAQELAESNFSKNLTGSGVTIKFEKGKGLNTSQRRGPDAEAIKSFVITFRNFILDADPTSIRNISKIYENLPDEHDLKYRFQDARKKFNDFLNTETTIRHNGEMLTKEKLIDTYIYGQVIHLKKNEEFKRLISIGPMQDITYNDIVYALATCANFIYFFNNLNKEYISTVLMIKN